MLRKVELSLIMMCFIASNTFAQENAAPSMHLTYYFRSTDAILKMQKIKIAQSADNSFFEVNSFTNGYAGLQQTSDITYGSPKILISSLWDANTLGGIYSSVDYYHSTTFVSRFGGEGDGWKTINPYNWELNTWYNLVQRSWKSNGKLYIATFINNVSTGKWFHTATLSIPDPNVFLAATNDAFMENWYGYGTSSDGRQIRKAFYKDCWNLNLNGIWEKIQAPILVLMMAPPTFKETVSITIALTLNTTTPKMLMLCNMEETQRLLLASTTTEDI